MYDARRNRLPASELKERRKQARRRAVFISIGAVVLLCALLVWVLRQEWFLIRSITTEGTRTLSGEIISAYTDTMLEGNMMYIFPRRNTLLLSKERLTQSLLLEYSRIERVTFDREGRNGLRIQIEEHTPHALWCGESRPLLVSDDSETCYFLNEKGYIFSSAPTFSGSAYFKYYGKLAVEEPLRAHFFSADELFIAEELLYSLTQLELTPQYLTRTSEGDYRITLVTGEYVLFVPDNTLVSQVDNLGALLTSEVFRKDKRESVTPLEYIDVRFGNKLYYRFRGESEIVESDTEIKSE